MRKYINIGFILGIIILLMSFIVDDVTFEIVGSDIQVEVLKKSSELDISEIKIKNTSDQPIRIKWTRIENTFPDYWDYSMCAYGSCQIGIPKGAVFKEIKPGEVGFIALHVFPKNKTGEGRVVFELTDLEKPGYSKKIIFQVTVEK
ncbi:MAG: hypothetical protein JKY42_08035 [Flavobacteriales bacterium]|nr:hypothetical protein [Flavobacteriales bacterium]